MSFWTFVFMAFGAIVLMVIGTNIYDGDKNDSTAGKEKNDGCGIILIACLFLFGGLALMGYSIYKYFIYDYTEAIEEAIVKHDFEEAHELLFEMSQLSSETKVIDYKTGVSKYSIASDNVLKAEITFLMNSRDKESSDRLISLIADLPIEASPSVGTTDESSTQSKNEAYSVYVGKFNARCDDILNSAISTGNRYLAERILTMYKPTLKRELEESNFFSADVYKYSYSNEMQIAARNRFEDAVRSGIFKDYQSNGTSTENTNVDLHNYIESENLHSQSIEVNDVDKSIRYFCKGDMSGFPIEMDIIVSKNNVISGKYRNIKYNVDYDLTGNYDNGNFIIKGFHGKAMVKFNLFINNDFIIGNGSEGKTTLPIKMNYTINNTDEYSTTVNIENISYRDYTNPRFNYTIKYPLIFTNIIKSDNGDGCIFSKDSNTYLKVYGMHNVLNRTIEEEFNKYKSRLPVYSLRKNNWFVISDYTEDGHIFYLKTVLKNDVFITAYLQYPSDQKELYSKMITKIFNDFPN